MTVKVRSSNSIVFDFCETLGSVRSTAEPGVFAIMWGTRIKAHPSIRGLEEPRFERYYIMAKSAVSTRTPEHPALCVCTIENTAEHDECVGWGLTEVTAARISPRLIFDREKEGLTYPAPDHPADCWDGGCDECKCHHADCFCLRCATFRANSFERCGETWDEAAFVIQKLARERMEEERTPPRAVGFADFTLPITLETTPKLPALLTREDGETLLYEARLNSIFGEPGTGKTWIAILAALAALRSGARVIWWDFEDRPATLATRLKALAASELIGDPNIQFVQPDMKDDPDALRAAADWVKGGERPGLVVIDSCESAGCPADSNNVAPWYRQCVDPWISAGAGVILLDHVPKRREDRPKGGIGSQHKLARVDGAALFVQGQVWTKKASGKITLTLHKDRPGDLPAMPNRPVAVVEGLHADSALAITIASPADDDDTEDLANDLLVEIAKAGPEGVVGSRAIRGLVKGDGRKIDASLDELIAADLVARTKQGRAFVYTITETGGEITGFVQSGMGLES